VANFFPHAEVRPFQDQFINTIFSAVEDGCSVAVEGSKRAPTYENTGGQSSNDFS
jgi:hypothetical protein